MSETAQAPLVTRTDLVAKVAQSMQDGPKQRLYKSDRKSMQVCTDKGKVVVFVAGIFFTADEDIIAYLDREIKGNTLPGIRFDANEMYFDPEKYDPMAKLRAQVRAELLAEMAKAADGSRDMGNYQQSPLAPSNTTNIAPTAAGNGPNAIAFQQVKK